MQSPRIKKPHQGLPPWPNKAEIQQADVADLFHIAVEINKLIPYTQNPAYPKINAQTKQFLAVDVTLFWERCDGFRPHNLPPGTQSPSQLSQAAANAVPAPGVVLPLAPGVGPAAGPAFSLKSFYDSQVAPLFAPGSFLRSLLLQVVYVWCAFWTVMGIVVALQYNAELSQETQDNANMGFWDVMGRVWQNSQFKTCLLIWPKLFIAYWLGMFNSPFSCAFFCRVLFIGPIVLQRHEWYDLWPWPEMFILTFFACVIISAPTSDAKLAFLYIIKFLFKYRQPVASWLLWEAVCVFLIVKCSTSKTLLAISKFFNAFFKNCKDSQATWKFLSCPSFDPSNTTHAYYGITFTRDQFNEFAEIVGLDTGQGRVTTQNMQDLWSAHESSMSRRLVILLLQIGAKLRPW